jgi:hypothetical protein
VVTVTATDDRADRLAQIAAELACRIRDEPADANAKWLADQLPEPGDWWELCFALAAAVPIDKPWRHLTAWTVAPPAAVIPIARRGPGRPAGKAEKQPVKPCGTRAAAHRHRYHKEPLCGPCREAEREHERNRPRRKAAA